MGRNMVGSSIIDLTSTGQHQMVRSRDGLEYQSALEDQRVQGTVPSNRVRRLYARRICVSTAVTPQEAAYFLFC